MNCDEFLIQFREALDGKVSENVIQENVNYYRSYIGGQTAKGKDESEVLKMLGDPRLLAKTIEESRRFASEGQQGSQNGYESGRDNDYGYEDTTKSRHIRLPGWLVTGIVVIAVLILLTVVFKVFVFLAPAIIVFLTAGFLVRTIRGWWRGK
ncbi:MAG: DUF1700 domain-containing protein [Lachnospiraceae bacterium]|nr:DUF1700 domain-containing protein [Lachnospiraceae bacterium]